MCRNTEPLKKKKIIFLFKRIKSSAYQPKIMDFGGDKIYDLCIKSDLLKGTHAAKTKQFWFCGRSRVVHFYSKQ